MSKKVQGICRLGTPHLLNGDVVKLKNTTSPKCVILNFKEEIEMDRDNVWTTYNDENLEELQRINESYKS